MQPMPYQSADDYYALLGVHESADAEELRKAWRKPALRWHPDRAGDVTKATFQRLSAAYTVLSDPIARAAYDRRPPPRRRDEPSASSGATDGAGPPAVAAQRASRLAAGVRRRAARRARLHHAHAPRRRGRAGRDGDHLAARRAVVSGLRRSSAIRGVRALRRDAHRGRALQRVARGASRRDRG